MSWIVNDNIYVEANWKAWKLKKKKTVKGGGLLFP